MLKGLRALLERIEIESEIVSKAEILLKIIGDRKLELENGRTLLLTLFLDMNNSGRGVSLGVLRKVMETRGVEGVFIKDDEGVSYLREIILKREEKYLEDVVKAIEENGNKLVYKEKLLKEVENSVEELVERDRVKHLLIILNRYGSISSEGSIGRLIYIGARNKSRELVEALLRNFLGFVTNKDVAIDKWRDRLSKVLEVAGNSLGLPGAELATSILVGMVKPGERKEGVEEIEYIDKIYREGRWALNLDVDMNIKMLEYYVESLKAFKEMGVEELKKRMESKWKKKRSQLKSWLKKELGKIEGSKITKMLLESEEIEILDGKANKERISKLEKKMEEVLLELDKYSKTYGKYKLFIKERIEGVLKKKNNWTRDIERELKVLYGDMIKGRDRLREVVEEYKRNERTFSFGYSVA